MMDRRSFFGKLFGGAAALVASPHIIEKAPRSFVGRLKAIPLRLSPGFSHPLPPIDNIYTHHNLEQVLDMDDPDNFAIFDGIEQIPDLELIPEIMGTKFPCRAGLGVTEEWTTSPLGYY
jgi:hypothetical protein